MSSNTGNQLSDFAKQAKEDPQQALNQGKDYLGKQGDQLKEQGGKLADQVKQQGGRSGQEGGSLSDKAQGALNQAKESLGLNK